MKNVTNVTLRALVWIAAPLLLGGCSTFSSITREENDTYVLTGWETPGPRGFVWVCTYDPATKTMTVIDEQH